MVRRMLRRLGWDRNPLRRRTDRQEAWLNVVLLIVLVGAGTPLAGALGRDTYREQARVAEWERQHRFEVWAVLLERAPSARTVKARWKAPDGSTRTGAVATVRTDPPGTWVPIWVDDTGAVVAAPPRRRPATHAAEVGATAVAALATGLGAVWLLCRRLLDRRRMRAWGAEWLDVGPRWSKYR